MSERIQRFEALRQEEANALRQYEIDYTESMDVPLAELKARWQRPRDEANRMLRDPAFAREMREYVLSRSGR